MSAKDLEMKPVVSELRGDFSGSVSDSETPANNNDMGKWDRFKDSFKRQEVSHGDEGKNCKKGSVRDT